MTQRAKLNVSTFPRPPACEPARRHVRIVMPSRRGQDAKVLVDSQNAYWVLETHHPPTYYIPQEDIDMSLLRASARTTFCEWKGQARYYDLVVPGEQEGSDRVLRETAWYYPDPTPGFAPIKNYVAFYPSAGLEDDAYKCFVDGERVRPQPGSFYGGWLTSDIEGTTKGGPGTEWW